MTPILSRRPRAARTWIAAVGGLAAGALAVAGCGGTSSGQHASAYGAPSPTNTSAPAAGASAPAAAGSAGGATVSLASTKLGKILVNSKGQTLYLFQADTGSASTCNGACASVWPPLTTTGKPIAGPGVSASKLGTTKRADGTTEVTYNGHPLYTFAGDGSPGQTTGQGNTGFGAEWDALSAAGNKL
jgi:predicted lipoprotein with Yx(FWY)xxD motif